MSAIFLSFAHRDSGGTLFLRFGQADTSFAEVAQRIRFCSSKPLNVSLHVGHLGIIIYLFGIWSAQKERL